MKRFLTTLALACAVLASSAQLSILQQLTGKPSANDPSQQLQKFNQFYRYLNASYVDTINNEQLIEAAIVEVLAQLDPHSAYVPAEDMKQVNESFEGSFSGIGVEFNVLKDTLIVVNTITGGPAEKVGVMPNDRIVEIDEQAVIGIKREEVPKKLRGPKGTVVEIKVVRHGEQGLLSFRIVRDNIPINSVDATYLLAPKVGYIKVNRFAQTTITEMNEALDKLGAIESLVLDLGGNGGGLLNQAVDMSALFLPKNSVVVSTEGRVIPPENFATRTNGRFMKGRLIVLIDESSASASEIVSGAIQDWDRGLVVGRRSFGKGLVQRQFPLIDGSAVRITVAHYHTPTGRDIQRPYQMGHAKEYYESFLDRFDQRALDSIPGTDSLKYVTLNKKRTVYGGGGIYPDVFVAADTTGYSKYWAQLVRRGVINEFVIEYMDQNRIRLESAYPNFDTFLKNYVVDQAIFDQLAALGEKREVAPDPEGLAVSREKLGLQLKALVAQKLWGMTEYYRVFNTDNPEVKEALRILENWHKYAAAIL